jgi:uncharacterized protein YkwD
LLVALTLAAALFPTSAMASERQAAIDEMVERVNAQRAQNGLRRLNPSSKLMGSAQRVSRNIFARDLFVHSNLIRIRRSKVAGETMETHSGGQPRPALALQMLMGSSVHRGLILGSRMRTIGAGVQRGQLSGQRSVVWILHLGR